MFNGIDVTQTRHYVKIDCHTYILKFCEKYLEFLARPSPSHSEQADPAPDRPNMVEEIQRRYRPN
jgi:hypothetical protein